MNLLLGKRQHAWGGASLTKADLTPNRLHSPPIRFRLSKSWVDIMTWQPQQIIQLVLGGWYAGSSQLLFLFAAYFSDLCSREKKVWPIFWRVLPIQKTLSDDATFWFVQSGGEREGIQMVFLMLKFRTPQAIQLSSPATVQCKIAGHNYRTNSMSSDLNTRLEDHN